MRYDDYLEHYGVKGMKWGRKKIDSPRINPNTAKRIKRSGPTSKTAWEMTAAVRSNIPYDEFKKMSEEDKLTAAIRTNTPTGTSNIPSGSVTKKKGLSDILNIQDVRKEPKKSKAARELQSKIKMNYTLKTVRNSAATKVGESVLSALKKARK